MERIRKRLKNERGFSLIELLIVIAIIALLAGLIIPRVVQSLSDAESSTSDANVKLVQSAVERYYFDKGKYPTSNGEDGAILFDEEGGLVKEGFIDEKPKGNYSIQNGKVVGSGG